MQERRHSPYSSARRAGASAHRAAVSSCAGRRPASARRRPRRARAAMASASPFRTGTHWRASRPGAPTPNTASRKRWGANAGARALV